MIKNFSKLYSDREETKYYEKVLRILWSEKFEMEIGKVEIIKY